jgi:hypothetical protein
MHFPYSCSFKIILKLNRNIFEARGMDDRLCGLVVRVLGYRSGGPDSIPGNYQKKK